MSILAILVGFTMIKRPEMLINTPEEEQLKQLVKEEESKRLPLVDPEEILDTTGKPFPLSAEERNYQHLLATIRHEGIESTIPEYYENAKFLTKFSLFQLSWEAC